MQGEPLRGFAPPTAAVPTTLGVSASLTTTSSPTAFELYHGKSKSSYTSWSHILMKETVQAHNDRNWEMAKQVAHVWSATYAYAKPIITVAPLLLPLVQCRCVAPLYTVTPRCPTPLPCPIVHSNSRWVL